MGRLSGAVGSVSGVASGRRRVKQGLAAYVSPMAVRVERQGKTDDTIARLLAARDVRAGRTRLEWAALVERALGELGQTTRRLGGAS